MRLSEWRAVAPHPGAVSDKVIGAIEPVLVGLGAEPDPPCWIAWGDDPAARYTILALCEAGIALCTVRVNVPQEGPRAAGKLVRWSRVQAGELSVETQGGHTLVNFQVENQLIRGVDEGAGSATEFALDVLAGLDGRVLPSLGRGESTADPTASGSAEEAASNPGTRPVQRSTTTGRTILELPPPGDEP